MRSVTASSVLVALLMAPAGAQPPPESSRPSSHPTAASQPSRWWHDESFKHALGLTAEQSAQIERIVRASVEKFREAKAQHDRLEAQLSSLIADSNATEVQVARQVDLVESLRSRMGKMRTMMHFRMRCVLTLDQRVTLDHHLKTVTMVAR